MLHVFIGTRGDSVDNVSGYFDAEYDCTWFCSQLAKDIIAGVDESTYVEDEFIKSSVLGGISPRDLSSGCKGLLLLLNEPFLVVCGERFGDNCFPWLFKIADTQDITITLSHLPNFEETFNMHIMNSDVIVHTHDEFISEILSLREKGLITYD